MILLTPVAALHYAPAHQVNRAGPGRHNLNQVAATHVDGQVSATALCGRSVIGGQQVPPVGVIDIEQPRVGQLGELGSGQVEAGVQDVDIVNGLVAGQVKTGLGRMRAVQRKIIGSPSPAQGEAVIRTSDMGPAERAEQTLGDPHAFDPVDGRVLAHHFRASGERVPPAPQAKAGDTELFQGQMGLFEKHAGIVLAAIMGQIDRTQTKGALRYGRAGVIG